MSKTDETDEKDALALSEKLNAMATMKPLPHWVNLAQLDGPLEDSLLNRFLYKPGLRFHTSAGGLWDQMFSGAPSIITESSPPSYRLAESTASKGDHGSIYNKPAANVTAISPLTLRNRNTIAVVFVAIGLLAAVAAVTGFLLHFLHPRAFLRANVRFTISNQNFTEDMHNHSSIHFINISKTLCKEMDNYFLTSELADFYIRCNLVTLRNDDIKSGITVHHSLDFVENKITNNANRIQSIIMRKAGRHKADNTLFLVIRDFLIYFKSLQVDLELLPSSADHSIRTRQHIPWRHDVDFIDRLPKANNYDDISGMKDLLKSLVNEMVNMTIKIDKMQDAIDFVNKTFYETHQPLFRLEETLNNMSISLENLQENLRNINQTLAGFKEFLKQFDNSLFKIDDIMKHIDDSVSNLGRAVNFVEYSVKDINSTVTEVSGDLIDIDKMLVHVNRSVMDVDHTGTYSNQTLNSMTETLRSLEEAMLGVNSQVNSVLEGINVVNISLNNITKTVPNAHRKVGSLSNKLESVNNSINIVSDSLKRLKGIYLNINRTLDSIHEPYFLVNGTVLEIITQLDYVHEKLTDIRGNMMVFQNNITSMNESLLNTFKWMNDMTELLNTFNAHFGDDNNSLIINIQNKNVIESIGMLLPINGTISRLGKDVEKINTELDQMDAKLNNLDKSLISLDTKLSDIDTALKMFNNTMNLVKYTVSDTVSSIIVFNSTLQSFNVSFLDLNTTLTEINNNLNKVNDSLSNANMTTTEIVQSTEQTKKAFLNLQDLITVTENDALTLNNTIINMSGSLPIVTSKLINANESLRILTSKMDNSTETYQILKDALSKMSASISEILQHQKDIENTVSNTEDTLENVNKSLAGVQLSHRTILSKVLDMQDSFKTINKSLRGFETVVPKLKVSTDETQANLNSLINNVNLIENDLMTNIYASNNLRERFDKLKAFSGYVTDYAHGVKKSLEMLQLFSKQIANSLDNLNEQVYKINDSYISIETNIRYINKTQPSIKDMFNKVQAMQSNVSTWSEETQAALEMINNTLGRLESNASRYSNIYIPFVSMQYQIVQNFKSLLNATETLKHFSELTNRLKGELWNKDGHLLTVHDSFTKLVSKTKEVNKILKENDQAISNVSQIIKDVIDFNKRIEYNFTAIEDTKRNIDYIDSSRKDIQLNVDKIYNDFNDVRATFSKSEQHINQMWNKVLNYKFDNINDTYNASHYYHAFHSKIIPVKYAINDELLKFRTLQSQFDTLVDTLNTAVSSYKGKMFSLDNDSKNLINQTILSLNITNTTIVNVISNLDDIKYFAQTLQQQLDNIADISEELESILEKNKERQEYFINSLPQLEQSLEMTKETHNRSNVEIERLKTMLQNLTFVAKQIEDRSDSIYNLNMTIKHERILLQNVEGDCLAAKEANFASSAMLNKTRNDLMQLNYLNMTLAELQQTFEQYNETILKVNKKIHSANETVYEHIRLLNNISNNFTGVMLLLDKFSKRGENIIKTNQSLNIQFERLNNISLDMSEANAFMTLIRDNFESIRTNYANFTATEINLNNSNINQALIEAIVELQQLAHVLNFTWFNTTQVKLLFDETKTIYVESVFNRSNTNERLLKEIDPRLETVVQRSLVNTYTLDEITSRLRKTMLDLNGVNETVNINNQQILMDFQKKSLADKVFPSLISNTENANSSFSAAEKRLDQYRVLLLQVTKEFEDLTNRLESSNEFNVSLISLHDIKQYISKFNETLSKATHSIANSRENLGKAISTMWQDDNKQYLTNETLLEMNTRYDRAHNIITSVQGTLFQLETDLKMEIDSLNTVNNDLLSYNTTLNNLHNSNNKLDALMELLRNMENKLELKSDFITQINNSLSKLDNKLLQINERFRVTNMTDFNNHIMPLVIEKLNVKDAISNLNKMKHALKSNINAVSSELYKAKNRGAINNTTYLKSLLEKDAGTLLAAEETISNVTKGLTEISHISLRVNKSITSLNTEFEHVTGILSRLEKEEVFQKYYPGHAYMSLNETLEAVMLSYKQLNEMTKTGFSLLQNVTNEYSSTETIPCNFISTNQIMNEINRSIGNIYSLLLDIVVNYTETKSLLHTNDGKNVSANETIQAMQERYSTVNWRLDNYKTSLQNINNALQHYKIQIFEQKANISYVQRILHEYIDALIALEEIKSVKADLNETLVDMLERNQYRRDKLVREKDKMIYLNKAFQRILATNLHQSKTEIDKDIEILTKTLSYHTNNANFTKESLTNANKIIERYTNESRHNNCFTLARVITELSIVNTTLNETFLSMQENVQALLDNGTIIDADLVSLENNLTHLNGLLLKQEKELFLQENIHTLDQFLKTVNLSMHQTFKENINLDNENEMMNNLLNEVLAVLNDEPTIRINLTKDESVRIVLQNISLVMNQTKDGFDQIYTKLLQFNVKEFIKNMTIVEMKSSYDNINISLIRINKDIDMVSSSFPDIQQNLKQMENFLSEIKLRTNEIKSMRKNITTAKLVINKYEMTKDKIAHEITSVKHRLLHVNNTIIQMEMHFRDVRDPFLHKDLAHLEERLQNLIAMQDELTINVTDTEKILANANNELGKIWNEFRNTTMSLDDLKRKVSNIKEMKHTFDDITTPLNMSQETILSNASMLNDELQSLQTKLKELNESFRLQQIKDHMFEFFPALFAEYEQVNKSISDLQMRFPLLETIIDNHNNTVFVVQTNVKNLMAINMSFQDILTEKTNLEKTFTGILAETERLVDSFPVLQDVMSSKVEFNETLDTIKERLKNYDDILKNISTKISAADNILNKLTEDLNQSTMHLSDYNVSFTKYVKTVKDIDIMGSNIVNSLSKYKHVPKTIHSYTEKINSLTEEIRNISTQFLQILSPELRSEMENITRIISTEGHVINMTYALYLEETNKYNGYSDNITHTKHLLQQNITNLSQLNSILNIVDSIRESTASGIVLSNNTMKSVVMTQIERLHPNLQLIEERVSILRSQLIEKEKSDFIAEVLPQLHSHYKRLNQSLPIIMESINAHIQFTNVLNSSLMATQDQVDKFKHINMSFIDPSNVLLKSINNSVLFQKLYNESISQYNLLDKNIFSKTNWSDENIDSIKNAFIKFNETITMIENVIGYTNETLIVQKNDMKLANDDLGDTWLVLSELDKRLNSNDIESSINRLKTALFETNTTINNISRTFNLQYDTLSNLTRTYSNVTNTEIKETFNTTKAILDGRISPWIPLAYQLSKILSTDHYSNINEMYNDVVSKLNDNYTEKSKISQVLKEIDGTLSKIQGEIDGILSTNALLQNNASMMLQNMQEVIRLSDALKEMLETQNKRDYFSAHFPDLLKAKANLKDIVDSATHVLLYENNTADVLEYLIGGVNKTLDNLKTFTISTHELSKNLEKIKADLFSILNNITKANMSLNALNLKEIDMEQIANDRTKTIEDVKELIKNMNDSLLYIGTSMNKSNDELVWTNKGNMHIKTEVQHLNQTVHNFLNTKENLQILNNTINNVGMIRQSVKESLEEAANLLQATILNFHTLKLKYNDYDQNYTRIEEFINDVNETLSGIHYLYHKKDSILNNSFNEIANENLQLHSPVKSRDALMESILRIEQDLINITENVVLANASFEAITSKINDLIRNNLKLDKLIQSINNTLLNEHEKSYFVKTAQPQIEKKYVVANQIYDITNTSLQKMQNRLNALTDFAAGLKVRMNGYESINISLQDTDSNLTHIANRLIIMQDHYNNVKEIVTQLKQDMISNTIFGKNISLHDVEHQYNVFNNTLDMVNIVLSKVENETVTMDEHFGFLNSTLLNINTALDIFEEDERKAKVIGRNMESIDQQLKDVKSSLIHLKYVAQNVNQTFTEMKTVYEDLMYANEDNNARLNMVITDAKISFENVSTLLQDLDQNYIKHIKDFSTINTTLFKNISSYTDLQNTLLDVNQSFFNLQMSLMHLENTVLDMANDSREVNTTYLFIQGMLNKQNETLYLEKLKIDFMNKSIGKLKTRLSDLKYPLASTHVLAQNTAANISLTTQLIANVSDILSIHQNIQLPLTEDANNVQAMDAEIDKITNYVLQMTDLFNLLNNNLTSLINRSENMSTIHDKYNNLNRTVEKILENVTAITGTLNKFNSNASITSENVIMLHELLNNLTSITNSSAGLASILSTLENNIRRNNQTLHNLEDTMQILKTKFQDMNMLYSDVDNSSLRDNLSQLIKLLQNKSQELQHMKGMHGQNEQLVSNISNKLQEIKLGLNKTIQQESEFRNLVSNSSMALAEVQKLANNLILSQTQVHNETESLTNFINSISDQRFRLDEHLATEKEKKVFIEKTFPYLESRYNELKTVIDDVANTYDKTINGVQTASSGLKSLNITLLNIPAMAIPLDSEEKDIKTMTSQLNDIERINNISDKLDRFYLQSLKIKDRDIDDIKNNYNIFNDSLSQHNDQVKKIIEKLNQINNSSNTVNKSVSDINSAVDDYLSMEEKIKMMLEAGNVMRANIMETNDTIVHIATDYKKLNQSLQTLIYNYSHINDSDINKTKDIVTTVILTLSNEMNSVNTSIQNLISIEFKQLNSVLSVNKTHHAKKVLLELLRQDTELVKNATDILQNNISMIQSEYERVNMTAANLAPVLNMLLNNITSLENIYKDEQEKREFIAKNRPDLEMRYQDSKSNISLTNKSITLIEDRLADLKYFINNTGTRLKNFTTLNVTINPEFQKWENMVETLTHLSVKFSKTIEEHENLPNVNGILNKRKQTLQDIVKSFNGLNVGLQDIESKIGNISNNRVEMDKQIFQTNTDLKYLNEIMDLIEEMQKKSHSTDLIITTFNASINTLDSVTNNMSQTISDLNESIGNLEQLSKPIKKTEWPQPFKQAITLQEIQLHEVRNVMEKLQKQFSTVSEDFKAVKDAIDSKIVTRINANESLKNISNDLNVTNTRLASLSKPMFDNNVSLSDIKTNLTSLQTQLSKINDNLHKELDKYLYVKQNLSPLQNRHTTINASNVESSVEAQMLIGHMNDLVPAIESINDKMRIFGLNDTDNSVHKWNEYISTLNKTVHDIIKNNQQSEYQLEELRKIMWSNSPMYIEAELVSDVEARFDDYSKKLEEIGSSSQNITLITKNLIIEADNILSHIRERDTLLTTTPATTTPSGPPDWLLFKTTDNGTLGKDSGFLECRAELSDWKMMTIKRVQKNGQESPVAAWKIGAGARKAGKDKRIQVQKTKVGPNSEALVVNIESLQCQDEGTYYCAIDSHNMWPLKSTINIISPPEDSIRPEFPTEVFEDKIANFSCTGNPGYPSGGLMWKIKRENDTEFRAYNFYSLKSKVSDVECIRTESNTVEYQFDMSWNNTHVRCYIENTDYYGEGIIRLLPYDICNKVRYLGTVSHPYTPHKYVVCGKELNIMSCPGDTCYDGTEENCIQCKASQNRGDPCQGQPLFSYVADGTDCKKYYICMGPTKTSKTCSRGYFAPNVPGNCVTNYARSYCGQKGV